MNYYQRPEVSKSDLDLINKSPMHYKALKGVERKPTPEMLFGQLFHCMVLEPMEVEKRFVVMPDLDRRTKEGKLKYEEFLLNNKDKTTVTDEMLIKAKEMTNALFNNKSAELFLNGKPEQEIYWTEPHTDVKCRSKIDLIGENYVVDLKTTQSAARRDFEASIAKYRYHVQAAFYLDAVRNDLSLKERAENFIFICIEKEPPYAVAVYWLDTYSVNVGRDEYINNLKTYKACVAFDVWPSYQTIAGPISLPRWYTKNLEQL